MKVAILTVVFPGVESFLNDMFFSLKRQTCSNFDVFIFNDGLAELNKIVKRCCNGLNVFVYDVDCSPVKIREFGIYKIIDLGWYDAILFCDSDDYFSDNRVAKSIEVLKSCDIVLNDLTLVTQDKISIEDSYLSNRLVNGQEVDYEYIKDKNVFGMSNTAVSTRKLTKFKYSEQLLAFDWFFFSQLLLTGFKAKFCADAKTFYRQHQNNVVGIQHFSAHSFLQGIRVKVAHYKAMSEIDLRCVDEYRQFLDLQRIIESDRDALEFIHRKVSEKKIEAPLWWERECLPEII